MPARLVKSRLHSNKQKIKFKPELNNTKSSLAQLLQSFRQKLLSKNGFLKHI